MNAMSLGIDYEWLRLVDICRSVKKRVHVPYHSLALKSNQWEMHSETVFCNRWWVSDACDERVIVLKGFTRIASIDNITCKYCIHITEECMTVIVWNHDHFISRNDIAKMVKYRLCCQGVEISSIKKSEEGIMSDLCILNVNKDFKIEEAEGLLFNRVPYYNLFEDTVERVLLHHPLPDKEEIARTQSVRSSIPFEDMSNDLEW